MRGEACNLFNRSNLYLGYQNTAVSSFSGAPIVTATRGIRRIENRNLQLAVKLIF